MRKIVLAAAAAGAALTLAACADEPKDPATAPPVPESNPDPKPTEGVDECPRADGQECF